MRIIHELGQRTYETDAQANLLLANNIGGFFIYSGAPSSRYSGVFFQEDDELYKTIESIGLSGIRWGGEGETIKNTFYSITKNSGRASETYFMPHKKNSIHYEHDSKEKIEISLDCRKAYDGKAWGRYYEISVEENTILIKYIKKKDKREDAIEEGAEETEYTIYTAIAADNLSHEKLGRWHDQFYPYDFERGENPKRGIYLAISLDAKRIALGFSTIKENAIEEAKKLYADKEILLAEKKKKADEISHNKIKEPRIDFAYLASMNAIRSSIIYEDDITDSESRSEIEDSRTRGIYAGYPWFFQFWTRDAGISARSLFITGKISESKEILMRYLEGIREDGWLPNRFPHADLDSADAAGWIFFRLSNLIDYLEDKDLLGKYFSEDDLKKIKVKLEASIYSILKHHSQNDMVVNRKKETWMDTDSREGVRVEIQALQLTMYSFLRKISKRSKDRIAYSFALHQEKMLLKKVRAELFKGRLYDGIGDETARPNIFIAYYLYPALLSQKEWKSTFDHALSKIWLPWGGVATIDKENPQFQKKHSGSNDLSYHKGDSWYFLNSMAAISLYRLDKEKYKDHIDKILEASTAEILDWGILGFHAEISSADSQESKGCLAQTWSSAMYIELVREILGD